MKYVITSTSCWESKYDSWQTPIRKCCKILNTNWYYSNCRYLIKTKFGRCQIVCFVPSCEITNTKWYHSNCMRFDRDKLVDTKLYVSYQNIQFRSYQVVVRNLNIRIGSSYIVCFVQTYQLVMNKLYMAFLQTKQYELVSVNLQPTLKVLQKAGKQMSNKVEVGRVGANEI